MTTSTTEARVTDTVDPVVLRDLLASIHACELERQTAQLSGLETGWEHPCTQTMWRRVLKNAERAAQNGPDHRTPVG